MENVQLKYILKILKSEHDKIFKELTELVSSNEDNRIDNLLKIRGELSELVDKEHAALGVYVDNAAKEVRENFSRIEMGVKNICEAIDIKKVKSKQAWDNTARLLNSAVKEALLSEEALIFQSLARQYEEEGDTSTTFGAAA